MSNISSLSYTNRDFATIYPELLDLAKTLTKKWDPSVSNESDPGVVLLKLNALVGDKCNYNIDKNILECFPTSVTQDSNARKLYEQLGYYMKWYQSAISVIGMGWIDLETVNNAVSTLKIPAFTMVSNEDRDIVYSIIGPYNNGSLAVSDVTIPMNGAQIAVTVMEGISVKYSSNGTTTITQSELDENNRLYFTSNDIAQNGIFICNAGNSNYAEWVQKDNLAIEPMNSTYYHFGIEDNKCYLEFPSDFSTIAGEGIEITYLRSTGANGNTPINNLTNLYEDISVNIDSTTITLNSSNLHISNIIAGSGGEDPESLDSAYNNYKKTVGTYNTLITLRDYFNAITGSGYASNAIVTDRSCDQQSSYKIMSSNNGVNTLFTMIDKKDNVKMLNAYDLKIYALNYCAPLINNETKYLSTFGCIQDLTIIKNFLNESKSISHDFQSALTPWFDESSNSAVPPYRSNIILLKDIYGISASITTIKGLESAEQLELKSQINSYLYQKLNSSQIDFGSAITPSLLEKYIVESDSRITGAIVSEINNAMKAVYWNGEYFTEVAFDRATDSQGNITDDFIYNTYDNTALSGLAAASTFLTTVSNTNKYWGKYDFTYVYSLGKWYLTYTMGGEQHAQTDITSSISSYLSGVSELVLYNDAKFTIEVNPIEHIKDEIYVKSILSGNTPIVKNDNVVTYSLGDKKKFAATPLIDHVLKVKAATTVTVPATGYTQLKDNDNLTFYCPSVIDLDEFGNYVRYAFISPSKASIPENTNTQLATGEYLFAFWKEENEYSAIYKYKAYGQGSIIYSNFNVLRNSTTVPVYLAEAVSKMQSSGGILVGNSTRYELSSSESAAVSSSGFEYLSGSKVINARKINTVTINDAYNLYWVLNSTNYEGKYQLFDENETTRILNTGEYFFYTTGSTSALNILGPGTKIVRNNVDLSVWSVPVQDLSMINQYGSSALIDYWMTMIEGCSVTISEQKYINLGSKCYIKITNLANDITITAGTPVDIDPSCSIQYLTASDDPTSASAEWNILEDFDINSINWTVDSSLSLKIGNNIVQELFSGQSLTVYVNEDDYTTINGTDATATYSALSLQSSLDIEITSANNEVYVYSKDDNNNDIYPTLWVYTKKKNFEETDAQSNVTTKVIYNGTSSLSLIYTPGAANMSTTLPVELPNGEYLIELTHECDDVTSLTVSATLNGTVTQLSTYNSNVSNFSAKNTYYIYVNSNNITNLIVNYSGTRLVNKVLTFKSPIKIIKPEEITSNEWTKYKNLIKYVFDVEGLYNYMYTIPSDNLIQYPLNAASFFDPHHPFSSISIPELNTKALNYKISARG